MNNSTHDARIELAIDQLNQQSKPNVSEIARKFGLVKSTLRRRYRGKTVSRHEINSEYKQRLNCIQEEALIAQINRLTDRGIPPTSQLVRNFAQEMIGDSVGKNWTGDFVKRHKDRLKSLYLRNIDSQRTRSEYLPVFQLFYDLVLFN